MREPDRIYLDMAADDVRTLCQQKNGHGSPAAFAIFSCLSIESYDSAAALPPKSQLITRLVQEYGWQRASVARAFDDLELLGYLELTPEGTRFRGPELCRRKEAASTKRVRESRRRMREQDGGGDALT